MMLKVFDPYVFRELKRNACECKLASVALCCSHCWIDDPCDEDV